MPEAGNNFLAPESFANVRFGFIRAAVTMLDFECRFIGTTVFRTTQRPDGAGDGRIHIGPGTGNNARSKGRGIELMFGIQDQCSMHGPHPPLAGFLAMQQMQEMTTDRIIVGLQFNAPPVFMVMVPVQQHGTEPGHEPINNGTCCLTIAVLRLRHATSQQRTPAAHDIHGMGRCRDLFQHLLDGIRQVAQ